MTGVSSRKTSCPKLASLKYHALGKVAAKGVPQPRPKQIFFQSNVIADEDLAVAKYVFDETKRRKLKVKKVTEI